MTEQGVSEEIWTYHGQREQAGKRYHQWADADGVERWYAKVPGGAVGGRYRLTVTREGDAVRVHGSTLAYTGERLELGRVAELEAAHVAAGAVLAAKALERKHSKYEALDEALQPLLRIARTLRTSAERDAFIAYIIRKITWGSWV
jgi:hypothetical protein